MFGYLSIEPVAISSMTFHGLPVSSMFILVTQFIILRDKTDNNFLKTSLYITIIFIVVSGITFGFVLFKAFIDSVVAGP